MHYVEWGRRTNPRVTICAHGYSGNARDFDFLATALARDSRVIAPDVAGRGESDWLSSPLHYHFGQFAADLTSLIAHIDAEEVDWIGTSMGGLLGMILASRPGSRIRRLVLNDIGGYIPPDALADISRNLDGPRHFATLAEAEAHFRRTHREWGDLTDEQWQHFARHGTRPHEKGLRLHYDPQIAQVAQPHPLSPGAFFWDAWYQVRCPVLLLRGENSAVFPESVARHMLAVKPQARLVEIPGAGHAPALMSEDQIGIVRDFLLSPSPLGAGRGEGNVGRAEGRSTRIEGLTMPA